MTNTEQTPNDNRPAVACQVQHTVRPGAEAPTLVERLRTRPTGDPYLHMMVHEAADEIERLQRVEDEWAALSQDEGKAQREIERLRAALTLQQASYEREIALDVAAERERCAAAVRAVPPHRWVDGSDQYGRPCPARAVATKDDYVAAILGA